VVGLLSGYEKDAGVAAVLADIKSLKEIYDQVKTTSVSSADVKTNPTTKVTTIGGKITYSITPELVTKLTEKSAEIRNKIISGQN
jgi:16S rRNA A1518/A1519 N6-dimethyltransferase RsmA/KsgA/DIM1 with predicted DNA glycosylase/AP lyase activity